MKEDSKPSNIACKSFVPHRFKATQCGRCFKSHAQHTQFMKGNKNNQTKILELQLNHNARASSSDEGKPSLKKLMLNDKVTLNGRNSLLADESGEITTDYFAPETVMKTGDLRQPLDDSDCRPRRQLPKKSAARRTREAGTRRSPRENGLKMNIPVDQNPLNNLSPIDVNDNKEHNGFDSSDNGSEKNYDNPGLFEVPRNARNGNANEHENNMNPSDSAGIQYLKAFQASHKSSIPIPKSNKEPNLDMIKLQEFQEVARNLRHVSNPNLDKNNMKGNHCQVVNRTLSAPSREGSPRLNRQDLEERQRMMAAKSSEALANTAFQTFSGHGKHDTLPRNLGTSVPRPSIVNGGKLQRQLSDPDFFQPAEKEEIQVVSISSTELSQSQDVSSKKQVVTTSKISSEIFFGSSSSNSRQRSQKQMSNSEEVFKAFLDHTEKPVRIVAADGSISHYTGSAETSAESNGPKDDQQRRRPSHPSNFIKPYKVVNVSHKPPEHPLEFDIPLSPKLPQSPSPKYKSSDGDLNANVDSEQNSAHNVFRFKGSLSKFPKRNYALIDGIYSVQDSVHFSQQDLKSPLSDADGETTPPFPILLSETESEHSDKRRSSNSSNYKVPIFISPKNYDNVGTVLSDREASLSDLSKDTPGTSGEGNYGYLTPMRPIKEVKLNDDEAPPVPVRTSSETQLNLTSTDEKSVKLTAPSKQKEHPKQPRRVQGKEPNSNNSQSSSESRWRSKTHPLGVEPIYAKVNVNAKKSNLPVTRSNTDVGKSKQKRVAPLPPNGESQDAGNILPDSLPRGLPPPPPGKEKRTSGEMDPNEAPPGRPVKPAAPFPPTDGQLGVIYEAMDRKPTSTSAKSALTGTAASSPSKPHQMSSNNTVQSPPKLGSAVTTQSRVQSPQERYSQTPTKGRLQSPAQEPKPNSESKERSSPPIHKEVALMPSPPRPMSPPMPCSRLDVVQLPDGSAHQSPNSKEAKSKRSMLPWKRRRKRGDRGSPERDFDATVVEKWLEGVHQLKLEEDIQRNSMDRLEVINAYRGEQTAFIDHSDLQSPSLSTSPEQNGDDSDGSGIRMQASSSSKRRAPKPPASGQRPASWMEGTRDSPSGSTEDFPQLQKCYSLSPRSRRASDGDTLVQYENTGILRQRQKKSAPPKPERRRRNMTTGFENLPSHKESDKPPVLRRHSSSDPDFTTTIYEPLPDTQPMFSARTTPLKSALKTPGSFETKKAESDSQTQPKRPVRIIAPEKDLSPQEPTFVNIYSNIEIVQRGLGSSDAKTSVSSVVFTADAETQCGWAAHAETEQTPSNKTGVPDVCESLLGINRMVLMRLALPAPEKAGFGPGLMTRPWEGPGQSEDQPCCIVPGGAFYKFVDPEQESAVTAVMIGTDVDQASDLLHVAQCSQTVSSHPNVMTICHASIESIPHNMLQPGDNQSKAIKETSLSKAEERVKTAVVLTDRVPITNAVKYVSHNRELHEYLPEKYEQDVALLILQLLSGIHHLQMHRVCLRSLKLDDLLLVDANMPGGGTVVLINLITSHLHRDAVQDNPAPGDIYGSPEQLAEKIAEFDVGLLVYEFLHRMNPFALKTSLITQEYEPQHLPPIPKKSRYSQGLYKLAGQLLRKKPSDRLSASQAISLLQCLLWGPPTNLMEQPGFPEPALQSWLATEQAKKVAGMCEYCIPRSEDKDKDTGYSLTDQLQCQFLSDISVQSLSETMKLLYR